MLRDFGCRYVLLGHSERRTLYGESDALVAAKFERLWRPGFVPVLCVGETLAEREAGLTEMVFASCARYSSGLVSRRWLVLLLAYEPVWAIGTGVTATLVRRRRRGACGDSWVLSVLVMPRWPRECVFCTVGSVKPQNAEELFGQPDIDGGLIGGAALVADDFLAICRAAN